MTGLLAEAINKIHRFFLVFLTKKDGIPGVYYTYDKSPKHVTLR